MKLQKAIGGLLMFATLLLGLYDRNFTAFLVVLPVSLYLIFSKLDWSEDRYGYPERRNSDGEH